MNRDCPTSIHVIHYACLISSSSALYLHNHSNWECREITTTITLLKDYNVIYNVSLVLR
ncbi:hypothetical protein L873DRAFT_1814037 [Choiromyces venosus 120613-1]|uniref:Uncharacterized protein n=1 Tax=Choiromyces venosus 120613-1 TaxID=1336337 RepID=A0A3N4J8C5_9PEZI|nr:hypothetical protein L873DRAFT_1814037 [Choiromyces venosus 120613-1]